MNKLRVWWIPQVPMNKPFYMPVDSVKEGVKLMDVLAKYDLYQYKNKVKPDYTNAGGLEMWDKNSDGEGHAGWVSWIDEETGIDDPKEYLREQEEVK